MPSSPQTRKRWPNAKKLVTALLGWFAQNARDLPWRRTLDPYAIWVSEIMLQQTQVKTVIPYWERWMRELPTIAAAANARSDKIHKLWEGLGYYTRARNLQKAAQIILERHSGEFPKNFDAVFALPGIGRYTAGAICSIAFNQPAPILDGNVIRVLTRLFGIAKNPKEKGTNALLWKLAKELVATANALRLPRSSRRKEAQISKSKISKSLLTSAATMTRNCSAVNQSLMEFGARICTPRSPQCPICPVKKSCVAFRDGCVKKLPNSGKRTSATARRFVAFVVERNGKILVRQRPAGVVNAHLWEFPNVEVNGANPSTRAVFKSEFGFTPSELSPLSVVKHSITRYRITLGAFRVPLKRPVNIAGGAWVPRSRLPVLAFTAAHGKILRQLPTC